MRFRVLSFWLLVQVVPESHAQSTDAKYPDLMPNMAVIPDDQNGAALLEELAILRRPVELRGYQFTDNGVAPDWHFSVEEEQVEDFFEQHGEVVEVCRRIIARPQFRASAGAFTEGLSILMKGCLAISAKAALDAKERRKWDKAWQEWAALHRFGCVCTNSSVSAWGLFGLGVVRNVTDAVRGCGYLWHDAPSAAKAARECKPMGDFGPVFATDVRALFKEYREHFLMCREGGDKLKRFLINFHLMVKNIEPLGEAAAGKRDAESAGKEVADALANREKRIEEMMTNVPSEVAEQLKQAAATDWDKAIAALADLHRAMLKTDCSTWERFQATKLKAEQFLTGFPLEQAGPGIGAVEIHARRYFETLARSRMMQVQLAITAARNGHKDAEVPDQLSELVPGWLRAVPADPFDGKPVRWDKRLSVLRCAGPDLKEEREIAGDGENGRKSDDVVVRLSLY